MKVVLFSRVVTFSLFILINLVGCETTGTQKKDHIDAFAATGAALETKGGANADAYYASAVEQCKRSKGASECSERAQLAAAYFFKTGDYSKGKEAMLLAIAWPRETHAYMVGAPTQDMAVFQRPYMYFDIAAAALRLADHHEALRAYREAISMFPIFWLHENTSITSGFQQLLHSENLDGVFTQLRRYETAVVVPVSKYFFLGADGCSHLAILEEESINAFGARKQNCYIENYEQVSGMATQVRASLAKLGFVIPEIDASLATSGSVAELAAHQHLLMRDDEASIDKWNQFAATVVSFGLNQIISDPKTTTEQKEALAPLQALLDE